MEPSLSQFAQGLKTETAFDVLALAKKLIRQGKRVYELQIGDSPFETPSHARQAGIAAIEAGDTHYGPSVGVPSFRATIAQSLGAELGVSIDPDEVLVANGAKIFQTFFCEAFLNPGDGALVFSPHFPTYPPNISRRGARMVLAPLKPERQFRPDPEDVRRFLAEDPSPKAIFLNFPHNPTGGVATFEDIEAIGRLIEGKDIALFSDEPYCHMIWSPGQAERVPNRGPNQSDATEANSNGISAKHVSPLQFPWLKSQTVACYTFSKSYSMSGWRLGFSVAPKAITQAMGKMTNTTTSCVPPFIQAAGEAALRLDGTERDRQMNLFKGRVRLLVEKLAGIPGVKAILPAGTFYAFPDVRELCEKLGIKSHGLALYLLEGADDSVGLACLGGECFGEAGQGFLRFSCAGSDEDLIQAMDFFRVAITRTDRIAAFLVQRPKYCL